MSKDASRMRNKMVEYLRGKKCTDCGNDNMVVFEFDHVRGKKRDDISKLVKRGCWSVVLDEIRKCDIVCANCHRIRTAVRNMDYRAREVGLVPGGQLSLF